jgi:hypothetical protein
MPFPEVCACRGAALSVCSGPVLPAPSSDIFLGSKRCLLSVQTSAAFGGGLGLKQCLTPCQPSMVCLCRLSLCLLWLCSYMCYQLYSTSAGELGQWMHAFALLPAIHESWMTVRHVAAGGGVGAATRGACVTCHHESQQWNKGGQNRAPASSSPPGQRGSICTCTWLSHAILQSCTAPAGTAAFGGGN